MIAKRAPRRKDSQSSYVTLARYLLDERHGGEKLIYYACTNTLMDDSDMAIAEIEATQALNQRAKSDKTYHLIASFPAGEKPSDAQLVQIEQRLCEAIGLGDHQRLSVVHGNTDNLHIHVAINKVHPQSLRLVTPHNDFYHLSLACRELEQAFGLQVDKGVPGATRVSSRAGDVEAHQGTVSFQRWVQGEPRERLLAALDRPGASWASLHRAAADYDLAIVPQGAGLIVCSRVDRHLAIKASQLDRRLGQGGLVGLLGPYETIPASPSAQQAFVAEPLVGAGRSALWQAFVTRRDSRRLEKQQASTSLTEQRSQALKRLSGQFAQRRADTRARRDIRGAQKRAAYSVLRVERLQQEAALKAHYAQQREQLQAQYRAETWVVYLQRLADAGDVAAVAALRRARASRSRADSGYVSGTAAPSAALFGLAYQVHRNGDVTYYVGRGAGSFTDEGRRIRVADQVSDAALEVALRLACVQFGPTLALTGSEAFQQRAALLAGRLGLAARFSDDALATLRRSQVSHAKLSRTDALADYVRERNDTARRVADLPPHRRFTAADAKGVDQAFHYRGLRTLTDGQRVALLERQGAVLVRPVGAAEVAQLMKHRVGMDIDLTAFSKEQERD